MKLGIPKLQKLLKMSLMKHNNIKKEYKNINNGK